MLSQLHRAALFAAECHQGQDREARVPLPYITHPMEVLSRLHAAGCEDEAMLCAALLHDVVEETEVTLEGVRCEFGDDVAQLVGELTRREPDPAEVSHLDKDQLWQLRADMLLEDIAAMSPRAMAVKLCDRLSNLAEAQRTKPAKKVKRYIMQSRRILGVIPKSVHPGLYSELETAVTEAEKKWSS